MSFPMCQCSKILYGDDTHNIYVHLTGCPEGYEYKEYQELPWWKKIFTQNPHDSYMKHFRL